MSEHRHAKVVIMTRDGVIPIDEAHTMLHCCTNPEIFEWLELSLKHEIYVDSPEHIRLKELTTKYETDKAIHHDLWW